MSLKKIIQKFTKAGSTVSDAKGDAETGLDIEKDKVVCPEEKTIASERFKEICSEVQIFIDKFYEKSHFDDACFLASAGKTEYLTEKNLNEASEIDASCCFADEAFSYMRMEQSSSVGASHLYRSLAEPSLDDMLCNMDKSFSETLLNYIDKKGITDVEAYKRSNVDKKTFSKIRCNEGYRPGKITAVSFAIGLRLSMRETEHLLSTAGMCLSRSNKFDVIIEYFILTGNYESIFDVNEVLYKFDQPLLGV